MSSTMLVNKYSNFVRAGSSEQGSQPTLTGKEARRLYLEEIKGVNSYSCSSDGNALKRINKKINTEDLQFSENDFLLCVQNNDVYQLKRVLDKYPEKLNILDNYGWSLLMIACQANSVETAKELLKRGINISIRDKAGNSVHSLVKKSKNYALADILLKHTENNDESSLNRKDRRSQINTVESRSLLSRVEYVCKICNKTYPDRKEHLSSTIHNISASKNIKVPAKFFIPQSNKGFQLMLKGGWDSISGLGRDGCGKTYPIKAVLKKDRKGLGLAKLKKLEVGMKEDVMKPQSKKMYIENMKRNRSIEINFRREFY